MFQTEIMLFLQSFASNVPTFLMRTITVMGYDQFFIVLILFMMFAVDMRKGFLLFQLIVWTGAATEILKRVFALPRPTWADSAVQNLETGGPNLSPHSGMGADGFLKPLPATVVETYRRLGESYGFPSGHVSSAMALWGGLSMLFKKRVLYWTLPIMVTLMALSRMFLGRHFLADVLGGALVGGLLLLLAYEIFIQWNWQVRLFDRKHSAYAFRLPNGFLLTLLLLVPPILALASLIRSDQAGFMVGVNGGFLMAIRKGLPDNAGNRLRRTIRTILVFCIFIVALILMSFGLKQIGLSNAHFPFQFLRTAVPSFIIFWAGIPICLRLGLYKKIV